MGVAFYCMGLFMASSCSKSSVATAETLTPATPVAPVQPAAAPLRTVNVSTTLQLKAALLDAQPGDNIVMADGTYSGKFEIAPGKNGTAVNRIFLTGSRNAVLNAGSTNTGYVLYLQANYWTLKGFTLTNGLKGIMADETHFADIDGLKLFNIGEEAIHLRKFSTQNIIQHCDISSTGLKTPDFGEGIYIGSAVSNWPTYTNGLPDLCDSNSVVSNRIGPNITAECIDVKEGTSRGIIRSNVFDATGITGANSGDSWMDVKGNYTLIENNTGSNPGGSIFKDGYQTHVASSGWGSYNEFRNNVSAVNAAGYGFSIQLSGSNGTAVGNKVYNNNTVSGAASGIANIPLSN